MIFVPDEHPPFAKRVEAADSTYQEIESLSLLECSTASASQLGRQLSAFNLRFTTPKGRTISVECAYQGSKVFEHGGPFQDLYNKSSSMAKRDKRVRKHGRITGFQFFNRKMPCMPLNAFYNWLYISTVLRVYPNIMNKIQGYTGFTDKFFNEKKGRSCQAEAIAMLRGLNGHGLLTSEFMSDWSTFYKTVESVIK